MTAIDERAVGTTGLSGRQPHRLAGRLGFPRAIRVVGITSPIALVAGFVIATRSLVAGALDEAQHNDDTVAIASTVVCLALALLVPLNAAIRSRWRPTWDVAKGDTSGTRAAGAAFLGGLVAVPAFLMLNEGSLPDMLRAGVVAATLGGLGSALVIGGVDSLSFVEIVDGCVRVSASRGRAREIGRVQRAHSVSPRVRWIETSTGKYVQPTVELLVSGVEAGLAARLQVRGAAVMLDADPADPYRGQIALHLGDEPGRILAEVTAGAASAPDAARYQTGRRHPTAGTQLGPLWFLCSLLVGPPLLAVGIAIDVRAVTAGALDASARATGSDVPGLAAVAVPVLCVLWILGVLAAMSTPVRWPGPRTLSARAIVFLIAFLGPMVASIPALAIATRREGVPEQLDRGSLVAWAGACGCACAVMFRRRVVDARFEQGRVVLLGRLGRPMESGRLGEVAFIRPPRARPDALGQRVRVATVRVVVEDISARTAAELWARRAATVLDPAADQRQGTIILELSTDSGAAMEDAIAAGGAATDALPDGWGGI